MNSEDRSVSRRAVLRGAAGAAAVAGASGTAAAAEEGDDGGPQQVDVVNYAFEPGTDEPHYVKPGTEVTWVWKSDGHNIEVRDQPEDANWEGHEELEDEGFEYSHTFEVEGDYHYVCTPHEDLGMVADIVVTENPPQKAEFETILPDTAKTLGIAATGAMTAVLGLAYFFMRYGGDYGEGE